MVFMLATSHTRWASVYWAIMTGQCVLCTGPSVAGLAGLRSSMALVCPWPWGRVG